MPFCHATIDFDNDDWLNNTAPWKRKKLQYFVTKKKTLKTQMDFFSENDNKYFISLLLVFHRGLLIVEI